MPRKSTVKALAPEIRKELDRILGDGRHTLDEVVAHLRQLGAAVSRSAVGRYSQEFEQMLSDIRLTREMAAAVGRELSDLADGDATEMLVESLQALLLKVRKQLVDGEQIRPKDVADLARAVKDLAGALRIKADLISKLRDEQRKVVERELKEKLDSAAEKMLAINPTLRVTKHETALTSDVIVAEESAQMGLPEILFNLFPGMGA